MNNKQYINRNTRVKKQKYWKRNSTILFYLSWYGLSVVVGTYALSVLEIADGERSIKHYHIRNMDDGGFYVSPRYTSRSLEELIKFHSGKQNRKITVSARLICRLKTFTIRPQNSRRSVSSRLWRCWWVTGKASDVKKTFCNNSPLRFLFGGLNIGRGPGLTGNLFVCFVSG